ncbi:transcriptional regulator [Mammaliicoccus sciuri]|uniref:transcriptional regulator n=1 Tax=Mammaliicoccus sciuri TaxID=1296 RepID=UPI0021D13281|nr:transcriptional regulator [Mammaliicoccus sciuri]UXV31892.1 transcriptional regulator [Mammaliicoccus sciuri]
MRNSTIKYLEEELCNYDHTRKRMKELREEIRTPWQPQDENIGGGRSNNNVSTTELTATRLVNDKRIEHLERVTIAIEKVFDEGNQLEQQLMNLYYFKKPRLLTVDGIVDKLYISRSHFYRIKKGIIIKLADELGIEH